MDKYKELMNMNYDMLDIPNSEYINFKKMLKISVEAKGYMCYCPSKKSGIMYYNPLIVR